MEEVLVIGTHPERSIIDVWVVPGAKTNEITGIHDGALRIRVAAPPERGRANDAAAAVLREALAATRVYLERGHRSRRKQFVVVAASPEEVKNRLGF